MSKKQKWKQFNRQLILEMANYYVTNKSTFRKTAKEFKVSKSTVHAYLRYYLKYVSLPLSRKVNKVCNENIRMRHKRGGEATKMKYRHNK